MGRRHLITLLFIVALVAFSVSVLAITDIWGRDGMTLGLDLKGGVYLEYQADFGDIPDWEQEGRLEEAKRIIEKRVNEWGVGEPDIYTMSPDRIVVQLPGFADIEGAKELVGSTAELMFYETAVSGNTSVAVAVNASDTAIAVVGASGFEVGDVFGIGSGDNAETQTIVDINTGVGTFNVTPGFAYSHIAGEDVINLWTPATGLIDGEEYELTGKYLLPNTYVDISQGVNLPVVAFQWDDDGAKLFSQITGRLIDQPLGIFLDNELISAPTVNSQIAGSGIIEGMSLEEAQQLSIQLNTGALPITLHEIRTQKVDPTLGADSLEKGMLAGVIGLALLLIFMILYYRLPGFVACLALIVYGAIVLALFKLWPVTLTLAGIAALILSIGMAVDANVLIFERMKEELRSGRTLGSAIETGFNRAWPAIRDSNVSTLITCIILFWFGNTFGAAPVMGFALTLGIGVAVSMFTAIVVTRTFLRTILFTPLAGKVKLFRL
ncbi:MAG: protein translocase subunit SecD [Chloroflexota bacterium]|nr:protein translocase subunit SecD [Chloroflexota bacterium]